MVVSLFVGQSSELMSRIVESAKWGKVSIFNTFYILLIRLTPRMNELLHLSKKPSRYTGTTFREGRERNNGAVEGIIPMLGYC